MKTRCNGGRTRLHVSRLAFALCLVPLLIAQLLVALPAAASQMEDVPQEAPEPAVSQHRVTVPPASNSGQFLSQHMWVNAREKLGYYLRGDTHRGGTLLFAQRMNAEGTAAQTTLQPPAWVSPLSGDGQTDLFMERAMRVDEAGGRLFVATGTASKTSANAPRQTPNDLASGQPCVHGSHDVCVGGVWIRDAVTLEPIKWIPLPAVDVDGRPAAPTLLGMEYAPGEDGHPDQLLMIVGDLTHHQWSVAAETNPRRFGQVVWLMSFNLTAYRAEWTVRLESCRGFRSFNTHGAMTAHSGIAHESTVMITDTPRGRMAVVGCHTGTGNTGIVLEIPLDENGQPPELPIAVAAPEADAPAQPAAPAAPISAAPAARTVVGPDQTWEILADPAGGRMLFGVIDGSPMQQVWYVYDAPRGQFLGAIGIGAVSERREPLSGLDPATGRLYVATRRGFYIADTRRTPVPQALFYPDLQVVTWAAAMPAAALSVASATEATPARIYAPDTARLVGSMLHRAVSHWYALEDPLPIIQDAESTFGQPSLDLVEAEGVTSSTFDGAARGYGVRALLVGGVDAAVRAGPVDAPGALWQWRDQTQTPYREPWTQLTQADAAPSSSCTEANREIVLASVGPSAPSIVDANGGRGTAQPLVLDSSLMADMEAPASRCSAKEWDAFFATALLGQAPVSEPSGFADMVQAPAECSAEKEEDRTGDSVLTGFYASTKCDPNEASGVSYVRGVDLGALGLAEALSSFRIYRDPQRGIVSRVESVARGLRIPGILRIDTVRGMAESWANGRTYHEPLGEEKRYDPNCDYERTAGTCFRPQLFGVWTPGWSCGPCGNEQEATERLTRALGAYGSVKLRQPDPELARGTMNGSIAAVAKATSERFSDLTLNQDLIQTVLPTLEIIRQAPPFRYFGGGGPRGRQIYQFAGVEVSSSYAIQCLLVYDVASNTCAEQAQAPASIQVSLGDTDGKPLAGGAFEVLQDVDADGLLGLKDTLLPDGACVTADDGVGTCKLENLQPGTYLVSQVAAPPGYAKAAEPFVVELASGEERTVAFTNVSNVSTIDLKVADDNGAPLSGAVFAAYPDADSDGKVAPDAQPAEECTTDSAGACQMKVPAGSYVLVQMSAPGGLEGIEPVPFTFASGGQVASVSVVNYPPESPAQPEGAASPVYTPPVDMAPPTERVDDYEPVPDVPVTVAPPAVSVPDRIGGTVTRVIRAPGDALSLLARDPKQAVAWIAALALFVLAIMAVGRRQQAIALISQ